VKKLLLLLLSNFTKKLGEDCQVKVVKKVLFTLLVENNFFAEYCTLLKILEVERTIGFVLPKEQN
jgi:hypothetical protein